MLSPNEAYFRWQYRFLQTHVSPDAVGRILDLGCGDGELLLSLAKLFPEAEITGVDEYGHYAGSGERRARAAGLISEAGVTDRCRIVQTDILKRPFPAGSFELVHARNVLHHCFDCPDSETKITSFFKYLHLLLSKRGYFVLTEIGPVNYLRYLKYVVPRTLIFINQAHNMDYRGKLPLATWLAYLRTAGFERVHAEYYVPYRFRHFTRLLNNEFAARFSHSAYSLLAIRKEE